jgi:acetylornithine deacetylase
MNEILGLLMSLISTPSVSRQEKDTADILEHYLSEAGISPQRLGNNVVAMSVAHNPDKPNLLLCSHHDTVKPALGYTRDPYMPVVEDGKLYGLGSNDAGGALVCLTQSFIRLQQQEGAYNLILVLSAEEEVSGTGGLAMVLPHLPPIDAAIIGEPTGMQAAIGERGLMVLDGEATGVSGHAARGAGVNAIYQAIEDINTLRNWSFVQVTQIEAGTQHNVVPDRCRFVVDVRNTGAYTNSEILEQLQSQVKSKLTPRSLRHSASSTPEDSPLMQAVNSLQIPSYISPTTSDWIQLSCPALKIGPGQSNRSHTADEFILLSELEDGLNGYLRLLQTLNY